MELKFKLKAAALNSALDVVSNVSPYAITPQGGMGYLFVIRNNEEGKPRCFVYSRGSHQVSRADFEVFDVEGEGAFIYPSNFTGAFKHVKEDVSFTIEGEDPTRTAKYTFSDDGHVGKGEVPVFDHRLLPGCDKELNEAGADEKRFPVAVLREAIAMANPFLPKSSDQHLQDQYKTMQVFDGSGGNERANGNLFASNSVQAFFFQCDAFKDKTFAVHQQHLPNITSFLSKCEGMVSVRHGVNMTFAIGKVGDREQVLGWVHHKARYDKFMYYSDTRDKIIMSVNKETALSRLAYTKAMLDSKRDKIRVTFEPSNNTLQFQVLEGNAKTEAPPFSVGLKNPESDTRPFQCYVNIDHLVELFRNAKAQEVELRVAFTPQAENRPREVVMFRTVDEFWLDTSGRVVGGSGVVEGKEPEDAFRCKVTRFMPDKA